MAAFGVSPDLDLTSSSSSDIPLPSSSSSDLTSDSSSSSSSDSTSSSSDDEFDDDLILMLSAIVEEEELRTSETRKRKRSCWVRDRIAQRPSQGAYVGLLQELVNSDPQNTKTFLRMSFQNFQELLEQVSSLIKKKGTSMRQAMEPGEQLAITLGFLASGNTFRDLMFLFRVPDNTIHGIVMETCEAIYKVLKDKYLKIPNNPAEWHKIALDFEGRWNLPNCIGALDGKHIMIQAPGKGSAHFNSKGFNSIILLALVDAKYRFTFVDCGANGRAGDARVFRDSLLYEHLERQTLGLPQPKPLPGRTEPVPFFIVGDAAFPLKTYLMKPYPSRQVQGDASTEDVEEERRKQRIYNYRHSRARRLSENAFGILTARFGVFHSALCFSAAEATTITLACLALHNFLMSKTDRVFAPQDLVDREDEQSHQLLQGQWRANSQSCFVDLAPQAGNRSALNARQVRDELKEYVNCEGQVCWQQSLVFGSHQ